MITAASLGDPAGASAAAVPRSIVLVGPLPPPSGGMANQTRQLAALLSREGCRLDVVQVNAPYRPEWVARLRGVRAIARLVPYLRRLSRAMAGADVVHVMANSGWAWHLFAAPAIWIAWLKGVPAVVNYRGGDADAFFARRFGVVRPTLARACAIAVPSGFLAAVFGKYGISTATVPNIVDLDAFRPAAALPDLPHLLVTRNLEAIYDVATALRAFAIVAGRYPEARLTVAGSGPDRDALELLARKLDVGEHVHFTGQLDNAELPALYRRAAIAVNASRIDNMPIALLEAMASGVPIVSTDVGGIPHLVEHGRTALLVPAGDPVAMSAAIVRLLEDRRLALALRAAGIAAARQYGWPAVRAKWFGLYSQIQSLRPATPAARRAESMPSRKR
ncbi:MAG TPA: glycosyltransferase family 4 protein [Casimicrobiaceae bacterium]|nr:glycosyltransferase family 4 protein [Casimicrobiaceae bacterium]